MSSPSVRRALSVALVLAAAACSGSAGVVPPASTSTTATTTTATTATTTPPPALCPRNNLRPAATYSEVRSLSADDPAAAAVQIARDRFECAAEVVVVAPGDLVRVALAARLAAARQAPLLFAGTAASPVPVAERWLAASAAFGWPAWLPLPPRYTPDVLCRWRWAVPLPRPSPKLGNWPYRPTFCIGPRRAL